MTSRVPQEAEPTINGEGHQELIDDDIHHTVERLLTVRSQNNNLLRGKKELLESVVSRTLQEERNQWKERLQLSMLEIDRQHRVILAAQTGLQDLVRALRYSLQKHAIIEEEDEGGEIDQGRIIMRLMEDLKFQVKQLKVRAGINESSKQEIEERQNKHKQSLVHLKETVSRLEMEKEELEQDLMKKSDKVNWLSKENATLHKQVQKLQIIVARYNENHSGTAFHLNMVEMPAGNKSATTSKEREAILNSSGTMDSLVSNSAHVRERTYIEGDQMHAYPAPNEENDIIKDRLRKNIYSVRKGGGQRSTTVSQCLRCQTLFKPAENNHKACRFHHKGREITEKFDVNGKIEKVVYKWACCKKSLESPGCCFGYHV